MKKQKDAYYFSHDANARYDEKIILLRMKMGWEGYGIFWAIIEKLRESTDYICLANYNLIAYELNTSADKIEAVISDFGLFQFIENGEYFFSESLTRRMKMIEAVRREKSEKMRALALKRWQKNDVQCVDNTEAMRRQCVGNANKIKETKIKETKIKESKIKEQDFFSAEKIQQLLHDKPISKDQLAVKYKITPQRLNECIKEFAEYKSRHGENTWQSEGDMSRNFEFWLSTNAHIKIPQKKSSAENKKTPTRDIFRNKN